MTLPPSRSSSYLTGYGCCETNAGKWAFLRRLGILKDCMLPI